MTIKRDGIFDRSRRRTERCQRNYSGRISHISQKYRHHLYEGILPGKPGIGT